MLWRRDVRFVLRQLENNYDTETGSRQQALMLRSEKSFCSLVNISTNQFVTTVPRHCSVPKVGRRRGAPRCAAGNDDNTMTIRSDRMAVAKARGTHRFPVLDDDDVYAHVVGKSLVNTLVAADDDDVIKTSKVISLSVAVIIELCANRCSCYRQAHVTSNVPLSRSSRVDSIPRVRLPTDRRKDEPTD